MKHIRPWVGPVLALAAALVVLLLPGVGWIARQQMALQFLASPVMQSTLADLGVKDSSGAPAGPVGDLNERMRAALAGHPRDAASIAARAWYRPNASSDTVASDLRASLARLPDDPALHAHILRFYSMGRVRCRRPEEHAWVVPGITYAPALSKPTPPDPAAVEAYLASASAGERLDPRNAYFPFMSAVALFAQYKDRQALAALHRAALKEDWNDYALDEERARVMACDEAFGQQGALVHLGYEASVLFPHYAGAKSVVRVAIAQAAERERRGRLKEALSIRHDVMRVGALMRARSASAIGTVVGCALTDLAASTPGVGPDPEEASMNPADRRAHRNEVYLTRLRRNGQLSEANWQEDQLAFAATARTIVAEGMPRLPIRQQRGTTLTRLWIAGAIAGSYIVWFAVMGALCALVASRRAPSPSRFAVPVLMFLVVGWLSVRVASTMSSLQAIERVLSVMNTDAASKDTSAADKAARAFVMLAVMALPAVVTGIVAAVQTSRGKPILAGAAAAFPWIVLALLVLYVGLLAATASQEREADRALGRMLSGEGRYSAELTGRAWPPVEPGPIANRGTP